MRPAKHCTVSTRHASGRKNRWNRVTGHRQSTNDPHHPNFVLTSIIVIRCESFISSQSSQPIIWGRTAPQTLLASTSSSLVSGQGVINSFEDSLDRVQREKGQLAEIKGSRELPLLRRKETAHEEGSNVSQGRGKKLILLGKRIHQSVDCLNINHRI